MVTFNFFKALVSQSHKASSIAAFKAYFIFRSTAVTRSGDMVGCNEDRTLSKNYCTKVFLHNLFITGTEIKSCNFFSTKSLSYKVSQWRLAI
jgi:hypothetical protein